MPASISVAKRPAVLIVRDGWGANPDPKWDHANAVKLARHPVADRLTAEYPNVLIRTSGFDVGLPENTMGNSEVGHQNLGAGRIVDQESVRITKQVRNGEFFDNKVLREAVDHAAAGGGRVHIFGIASDAGVHGLLEHLFACLELCKRRGFSSNPADGGLAGDRVFLHAFTDGRDTSPNSGLGFVRRIEAKMAEVGVGRVATVSGRYWAMDRDNRWPRVEKAYRAIAFGDGPRYPSAEAAIQHYYANPTEPNMAGDEFVTPCIITGTDATAGHAAVRDGDSVIFYNYRGDRPRELTKAFVLDEFPSDAAGVRMGFDRGPKLNIYFATMTAYEAGLPVNVAYPKAPKMANILGELVSGLGMKQFRCAETEKFPHVTFFFNDYRNDPFPGEDRQIVPSPTDVSTYDQRPEMSAYGIADETVRRIDSGRYGLVVVNFANADMVGHTGVLEAAVKACEHVDACVGKILEAVTRQGGSAIVTADHGNAEQMIDPATGGPHTAHTTNPVELVVMDDRMKGKKLNQGGRLADVAPTLLHLLGLDRPAEMTGRSLIVD
ncbi:MAG: pgm [Phycisphaerales bacterium]|nr:pgm [Phycisphaerales bacterium]